MKIKKSDFRNNQAVSDEFLKNEYRTNKVVSIFLFGFVLIGIVNNILIRIDTAYDLLYINQLIFVPINIVLICMIIISWIFRFRTHWIKYMLLSGIILVTTVSFFTYTTYTVYLIFIPIFISARYFNKKIITAVSIVTAILFLVACILNVVLEPTSTAIMHLHQNASYNPWTLLKDAVIYIITPCLIAMFFLSVFAINMTSSGGRLISSKIASAKKIASVDAEISLASQIQKSVLPKSTFETNNGNFKLFAYESPAKEVCGDFYDYFMLNENTLAIIVADVSDKGMSAAMFMMSAKKVLQCALLSKNTLEEAIELTNRLICNDNRYGMFLTLWMGVIDIKSGMGKYINAGHPYPIIRHKNGKTEFIENQPDLFIGNFPEKTPKVHTFCLKPQDTLLIYTDGLTDATDKNGNFFGKERIIESLNESDVTEKDLTENSCETENVPKIISSVHKFTSGKLPFDDITILSLTCNRIESTKTVVLTEEIGINATKKIADTVQQALKDLCCPDEARRNIGVAVDEIANNISEYAYPEKSGKIFFSAVLSHNSIEMTFADSGTPFNPLDRTDPDTTVVNLGGLGIFFVKQLADNIFYEYKDNKNQLSLTFIWNI